MPTATQPLESGASRDSHYDDVATSGDELNRNVFLIKEHVALFKASSNYDVYDPQTGAVIMCCREPGLGMITKALRFTDYKRMTPFDVRITKPTGELLIQVKRGFSLFLSNVRVYDGAGELLGGFKQKLFSIGGSFTVLNAAGEPVCELKGKWTGWDFRFQSGGLELARVTKQWNGIGKELFTSADNYVLEIDDNVPPSGSIRKLILAAVMTIDLVLKE
jgi:uncharacterized protein YxjI